MSMMQNAEDRAKAKIASWHLRRKFFIFLGILFLGFIARVFIGREYTYSNGERAGVISKLSEKGYVYKTWEGELQISAGGGNSNVGLTASTWPFTVENNPVLIKALQAASAKGVRVSLHYKQKPWQFSIFGDTEYFVDQVEEVRMDVPIITPTPAGAPAATPATVPAAPAVVTPAPAPAAPAVAPK
jgi:hypothetical protein